MRVAGPIHPLQPASPGVWGRCPEELWQRPCSHPSPPPHTDVVPTPPDGPPTVASVTGRAITLTWNKPRWLDTAIGEGAGAGQGVGNAVMGHRGQPDAGGSAPTLSPCRPQLGDLRGANASAGHNAVAGAGGRRAGHHLHGAWADQGCPVPLPRHHRHPQDQQQALPTCGARAAPGPG